jgi:hypothetical protein
MPDLRALLEGGMEQPRAAEQRCADEAARVRERQNAEQLAWFRGHATPRALDRLPVHLRERAQLILADVEAEREIARKQRRETNRRREAIRL